MPSASTSTLSSFLLGRAGQGKDDALDNLFKATPAPTTTSTTPAPPAKKRKRTAANAEAVEETEDERKARKAAKRAAKAAVEGSHPALPAEETVEVVTGDAAIKSKKSKKSKKGEKREETANKPTIEDLIEPGSNSSETENAIVHESLDPGFASTAAAKGTKKARELADAESPASKNARSIFIGNVPLACATTKSDRRALTAHLIACLPEPDRSIKVESIRFRGLPLSEAIGEKANKRRAPVENPNHQQRRMSAWLNTSQNRGGLLNSTETDERPTEHAHKFLTAAQKRKVAAITGDVNSNADACIAYAVFTTPEEARKVISAADGTVFRERTLRVDAVRTPAGEGEMTVDDKKQKAEEERRTCFIGGLEFTETEEKLRAFVEATLIKERGEPDDDERWVQRVRIVRDKDTGLGKGFAYIMFQDRDCVDELLALEPAQFKLSKRKLRVQRCKSAAKIEADAARPAKLAAAREQRKLNAKLPKSVLAKAIKRDPKKAREMAKQLEGLGKEERRAIKSTDEDRKARRAAKKQDKVARERKERKRAARSAKA